MATSALSWAELCARPDRWFCSPSLVPWQVHAIDEMRRQVANKQDIFWLLSSGTQSVNRVKALALSRESIEISSASVNRHLQSDARDIWLKAIPYYHIGGLSIYARASLSGAAVREFRGKWKAERFVEEAQGTTLTSLVPTQVHDLVQAGLRAPSSLRAAVIGGGSLASALYLQARKLDWPLLPSYGLTECCSQVATASLASLAVSEFPTLEVLDHVQVELREQRVFLRSSSLCQMVATSENGLTLVDPCEADGWMATEDLAEWERSGLKILGRRDDVVKILGVLVSVQEVQHELVAIVGREACVVAMPRAREGHGLVLFTDMAQSLRHLVGQVERYNAQTSGPRRILHVIWVPRLPRSDLGKFKKAELAKLF